MTNAVVADSLRYSPVFYGMDVLMRQDFRRLDVSKLLICFIDTVDAQLLPYLAQEFDVLGAKGWDYADTEDKQRDLLKIAIALHRYMGTPWAVKQVVKQAGYALFEYVEGLGSWYNFRINIDYNIYPIDDVQIARCNAMVYAYKRASANFEGVFFTGVNLTDEFAVADGANVINGANGTYADTMPLRGALYYDGTSYYDGSRDYSGEGDALKIDLHY